MKKLVVLALLSLTSLGNNFNYEVDLSPGGYMRAEASFVVNGQSSSHSILTNYLYSDRFQKSVDPSYIKTDVILDQTGKKISIDKLKPGFNDRIRLETTGTRKGFEATVVLNCDIQIEKDYSQTQCQANLKRSQREKTHWFFKKFNFSLTCENLSEQTECFYTSEGRLVDLSVLFVTLYNADEMTSRGASKNLRNIYYAYKGMTINSTNFDRIKEELKNDSFYNEKVHKMRMHFINKLNSNDKFSHEVNDNGDSEHF